MVYDLAMLKAFYTLYEGKIERIRTILQRPLTLAEKILYAHLYDEKNVKDYKRGEDYVPASSLTATGTMLTEGVRLSDPVSGKNWNLGDTMMITIVRADVNLGKIDFEVAPESAKQ